MSLVVNRDHPNLWAYAIPRQVFESVPNFMENSWRECGNFSHFEEIPYALSDLNSRCYITKSVGYARQHILCLSQATINGQGCHRNDVLRKDSGMMGWRHWRPR